MRRNNYDRLAPFYDQVSRLVYGQKLLHAQSLILPHIKNGDHILLVGGGTGHILEELEKRKLKEIEVTYLEASQGMINIAERRNVSFPVHFVNDYAEDFSTENKWNIVITPFFFDNFQEEKSENIFKKLDRFLLQDGLFLYVDFRPIDQKSAWWKRLLLKTMYLFFGIVVHIETNHLVDMLPLFYQKYETVYFEYSFHKFLISAVFRKNK